MYDKKDIVNKILSIKLTKKQVQTLMCECSNTKRHWTDKKPHIINIIKTFGYNISELELDYFINVHLKNEHDRLKKQYFIDSQTGKIKTNLTPTDIKGTFTKVESPIIGKKYHISWAFSGAVFILKSIDGDVCYLDNPKYPRSKLITCKISELRNLRK